MCANGADSDLLSCAEAVIRRRADYRLSRLPAEQPLPRRESLATSTARPARIVHPPTAPVATAPAKSADPVHGTPWGYTRGCRQEDECPHWRRGALTCTEARRRYIRVWSARRTSGAGTPIDHGTSNGYLLGCRDSGSCPGGAAGTTCSEARASHRRRLAEAAGVPERTESVDAHAAIAKISAMRARGLSLRSIASMTGCGRTTIARLAGGTADERRRVAPDTLSRILAAEH